MGFQVEREVKILLAREHVDLARATRATKIRQVYLLSGPGTVRVRAYEDGRHELTVKFSRDADGSSEYDLPLGAADGPRLYAEAVARGFREVAKTRYEFPAAGDGMAGLTWEVDVFEGRFDFLTLAELEYPGPGRPPGLAARPAWYPAGPWGADVTAHGGFRNSRLVGLDGAEIPALRAEFAALLAAGVPAAPAPAGTLRGSGDREPGGSAP